jgi:signal transduction histidine kinase
VEAYAPLPSGSGWGVLLRLPEAEALGEIVRLRRAVLAALAAVLTVAVGGALVLAAHLGRGLSRIDAAARRLAAGDLSVRLPVAGADEVAEVSTTFNQMAGELEAARGRLTRWNEELQGEVEKRTAELRAAQAQLVEAQKLAAIGQLGAGVAHEINNPLTGILGHAQLLLEQRSEIDPDRESLAAIEEAARRCRDVTQKLLRFSQQRAEPEFELTDLNRVVSDSLVLAEGQLRASGITLDVALARPPPRVRGDAGHLAQVLLALLSNARTACAGTRGAHVRVSTGRDGGAAKLAVADDGKGIAPEHLPRIFEPFFTTKDQWSNVGLGLSVAYRIVAEHGGKIRVESRLGEGTTFTVELPETAAAEQP